MKGIFIGGKSIDIQLPDSHLSNDGFKTVYSSNSGGYYFYLTSISYFDSINIWLCGNNCNIFNGYKYEDTTYILNRKKLNMPYSFTIILFSIKLSALVARD
ncbi:MAG: hypothetical protein NT007_06330 [Candidatus Kapabacteria bacterium]|nr:hypothetical protein [Candidatus Kapabacteria bacterium]